jgi:hypothetical protein
MHLSHLSHLLSLCLFVSFSTSSALTSSTASKIKWLEDQTKRILNGCRATTPTNITLFTPDASNHYKAQYTRDFYYGLSGTDKSFWIQEEVIKAVNYTFQRQREDGCIPDKVTADNRTAFAPGAIGYPMTDHAWDNGCFANLLLTEVASKWGSDSGSSSNMDSSNNTATTSTTASAKKFFCDMEPKARKALQFMNISSLGLVYNDIESPNCTYGFTDNIAKSGSLLFTSLLYYEASMKMSHWTNIFSCGDSFWYKNQSINAANSIDGEFYDEKSELWFAATEENKLPDIWGSLYLISLNLSTKLRRNLAMKKLLGMETATLEGTTTKTIDCSCCNNTMNASIFSYGQVRHLPIGCFWEKCFQDVGGCPKQGTYQNGAYWSTPIVYLAKAAMSVNNSEMLLVVKNIVLDAMHFFQNGLSGFLSSPAINEAINPSLNYSGAVDYLASSSNTLKAVNILFSDFQLENKFNQTN